MPTHTTVLMTGALTSKVVVPAVVINPVIVPGILVRKPVPTGGGRVVGTTKLKGVPSNVPMGAKVRLYADRSGMLVQQSLSNPSTGEYEFDGVDEHQTYTVVAIDPEANYRAVVSDRVSPEPMP